MGNKKKSLSKSREKSVINGSEVIVAVVVCSMFYMRRGPFCGQKKDNKKRLV